MKYFLTIIIFTINAYTYSQNFNKDIVQQALKEIKKKDEFSTDKLAHKFSKIELLENRVRAIFEWQVNYMKYDYYTLNNNLFTTSRTTPEFALQYKKGICATYANLFKELCTNLE